MVIFSRRAVAAFARTHLTLAKGGTRRTLVGLLLATTVTAIVMVVRVVGVFFGAVVVVVVRRAILRIFAALAVRVFTACPMYVTGLLGGPFRGSLAVVQSGVLACRATRALAAMIAIGPVFALAIAISRVSRSTMLEIAEFALVALLQVVAQLALRASPDLLLSFLHESAIEQMSVKKALEVFGERNYRLVLELTSRPDVLRPVVLVEGHVKPFHLQRLVRRRDVTCGH